MAVIEITSFIVTASLGGIALIKVFNESRRNICSIIMNIILGGSLFAILNLMGVEIPFNLMTFGIITFLGVPGVILMIILKILFGIF